MEEKQAKINISKKSNKNLNKKSEKNAISNNSNVEKQSLKKNLMSDIVDTKLNYFEDFVKKIDNVNNYASLKASEKLEEISFEQKISCNNTNAIKESINLIKFNDFNTQKFDSEFINPEAEEAKLNPVKINEFLDDKLIPSRAFSFSEIGSKEMNSDEINNNKINHEKVLIQNTSGISSLKNKLSLKVKIPVLEKKVHDDKKTETLSIKDPKKTPFSLRENVKSLNNIYEFSILYELSRGELGCFCN